MAHQVVKVIRRNVVHYLDATPTHEEAPLRERVSSTIELTDILKKGKADILQMIKDKGFNARQVAGVFSDRSAPIPKMIDIINKIQESGVVDIVELIDFRNRVDRFVQQPPTPLAMRLGLNYLPENLDVYNLLRSTLDAVIQRV